MKSKCPVNFIISMRSKKSLENILFSEIKHNKTQDTSILHTWNKTDTSKSKLNGILNV